MVGLGAEGVGGKGVGRGCWRHQPLQITLYEGETESLWNLLRLKWSSYLFNAIVLAFSCR